jgi:hypothetical protein
VFKRRSEHIALVLTLLAGFLALSCGKKAAYPDAPEGQNYRTLQIAWKHEGASRGTQELYLETTGYEDGHLKFARMAQKTNLEVDTFRSQNPVKRIDIWTYNIGNTRYTILSGLHEIRKNRLKIDLDMRWWRLPLWHEILSAALTRKDLTMEQRKSVQGKIMDIQDEDLIKLGAKISKDKMMGKSVKRYEIPLNEGHGKLWMYGNIPLRKELEYKRGDRTVTVKMVATKFVLNKDLPEEPFTSPKGYKLVGSTKQIPAQ